MTYLTEMAGEICIAICDFLSLSLSVSLSLSLSLSFARMVQGESPPTPRTSAPPTVVGRRSYNATLG